MITCSIETVSPEIAKAWLEISNGKNFRRPNMKRVRHIADELRTLGWQENGETIKIDTNGVVIDGQHRLLAIVEAGVTVRALVVRGVEKVAESSIDIGERRTLAQHISHQGEANAPAIGTVLRLLAAYRIEGKAITTSLNEPFTTPRLLRMLADEPEIRQSVSFCENVGKAQFLRRSHAALLHYVVSKAGHREVVEKFLCSVVRGANLTDSDPIFWLRNRLIGNSTAKTKISSDELLALLIIAWNKWSSGTPTRLLRWRSFGPNAEGFPRISTTVCEEMEHAA